LASPTGFKAGPEGEPALETVGPVLKASGLHRRPDDGN
jgi:hypothetical protein